MYSKILLIFHLIVAVNSQGFGCDNPKLTDRGRKLFTDAHNDARRSLAKGSEPNRCGNMSSGSNIYELRWDCEMEKLAQQQADKCSTNQRPSNPSWDYFNHQVFKVVDPLAESAKVINKWWETGRRTGLDDPENRYKSSALRNFATMANGLNTAFACAYNQCGKIFQLHCLYDRVLYTNAVIYEKGKACSTADDCGTYPSSSCNDGLCKAPKPPSMTETFTMCDDQSISDQARRAFLDTHNHLRSRVAKGLEKDGISSNAFAPKAKQMTKLKYNCDIEANAKKWAKKCVWAHSPNSDRPNYGENLYYSGILNNDKVRSGEDASLKWWSELKEIGVGEENLLTPALFSTGVGHYTQMAWEKTTDIGCYVEHCSDKTYTVCQYGPPGNYMNQLIYTKGDPCQNDDDCPGSQTCNSSESLCVIQ